MTYRDDSLITRAELGATCGVSKRTIRRWEKLAKVTPFKNEEGVYLFRIEDVADVIGDRPIVRLKNARVYVPSAADASGELTAKVFDLLDAGLHPVNIVRKLRVNADVVDGLVVRWQRWRKAILLLPAHAVAIAGLLHITATRDATEFVHRIEAAIEKLEDSLLCRTCDERRAKTCGICQLKKKEELMASMRARYGVAEPPLPSEPAEGDDRSDDDNLD